MPTVAIIGAGMGGLAAIKHCLEEGLQPVCFESEDEIGGIWRYTDYPSHSSAYRNLHINTGRDVNAFGDYPIPVAWPICMPHNLMFRYLEMYAHHFGLRGFIRMRTRVKMVSPSPALSADCKWAIEWQDLTSGASHTEVFDAVMVCSGHHSQPRVPPFPGQDVFEGIQMHSHNYKHSEPFHGKRVVVIGLGNSGSDLTAEVSKVAEKTFLVARRGNWVIRNPWTEGKAIAASRFDSFIVSKLPRAFQASLLEKGFATDMNVLRDAGLKPEHRFTQQHPTLTLNCPDNNLFDQLKSGHVVVKRGLQSLSKDSATFTDGTTEKVDAVIYCTGYVYGHPFMDPAIWHDSDKNEVKLYNYMYMLNGCKTLSFIGLLQPLGAMVMIVDIQTRYAAKVLTSSLKLPSPDEMKIKTERTLNEALEWFVPSERHTLQVAVAAYTDKLADEMKVKPTLWRIITQNPLAFRSCFFCPTVAAHYRLVGPGKLQGAASNIRKEHNAVYRNSPSYSFFGYVAYWAVQLPLLSFLATVNQLKCLLTKGRTVEYHFA
eukprot:TRINITY_DN3493_c0_g1_i1.p1 TRINITY_DN3493_c0_g1~~TRINITY_DN3493_c0_g1_i1.p1  ORF type:complete len:551 (+),score=85.21 TRINITY_DN3493_c0_g1_i1:28-1653(+)